VARPGPLPAEKVQRPYDNAFASIWEYQESLERGEIDFEGVVGACCPICGKRDCWRSIAPYERGVIELYPYREGRVSIARFQCVETLRTFSLLPIQLAPYMRYTTTSVLGALLALWIAVRPEDGGFGRVLERDPRLVEESRVTAWLLETWLDAVLTGLRRSHVTLRRWLDVDEVHAGAVRVSGLATVAAYMGAMGAQAPPGHAALLLFTLNRQSRETGRFLFGEPSQERG
jgi:hypothetical protein